jgi:hypothetical protein
VRRLQSGKSVIQIVAEAGFQSIWYWVLHVVVWTTACYRTLDVPHDMLLRARRSPEIAERVDLLARLSAERIGGLHDAAGVPLAALGGFLLATTAALGLVNRLEVAQAALALLLPLALIVYSKLRLALYVRGHRVRGARLVVVLARRRFGHQMIAILAMLAATAAALTHRSPLF